MKGSKIKLAIVINDFLVGGAQKQLTELVPLLDRNKFDLSLITLFQFEGEATLYDQLPAWLPVYTLNFCGFNDISSWAALYKTLRAVKPDIVMSSLFFSDTVVRVLKPCVGYKVISCVHNTYVGKPRWQIITDKILSYCSYKIVAVSTTVADFTAKQEGISREKFEVIHNGIDLEKMQTALAALPPKDVLKRELGFQQSDKILLNVARLTAQKNHKLLIDGFALFHKKHPDYKLAIVGEGSLRPVLEMRAHALGLDGAVTFFGLRHDVERFYKASDVFILTSDIEGFAIVGIEAMACGLPVVSTKTAGPDTYIKEGENGFFIPFDSKAIVQTLEKMSTIDIKNMADGAKKTAQDFDIKRTAQAYEELFFKLISYRHRMLRNTALLNIKKILSALLPRLLITYMKTAVRTIAPSLIYDPVLNLVSHKTRRLRTNEELENRANGLKELRNVLLSLKIEYFISGGTLLGAIRENNFIKWDFDTDIDLDTRSVWSRRHQLLLVLKNKGFEVMDYRGDRLGFKIAVTKYGELYELLGYLKIGKFRYRMDSYYPDAICGAGTEVTLRNEQYRTFGLPIKYLEWFYGDWRSPVRSGVYVTTHSRVSPMRFIFIKIVSMFV